MMTVAIAPRTMPAIDPGRSVPEDREVDDGIIDGVVDDTSAGDVVVGE